jgi:hypothetical protein
VDVRLDPEPAPQERDAIVAALADAGALEAEAAGDIAWWRAGLPDRDAPRPPLRGAAPAA